MNVIHDSTGRRPIMVFPSKVLMLNGRGIRTVSGPCGTCPYISSYSSRTSGTSSSGRSFRANIRPSSLCALMSQFLEASSDHVPTFSYSLPSNRTYSDNSRFHHRHDISRKDGSPDVSTDNIRMFQPTIFGNLKSKVIPPQKKTSPDVSIRGGLGFRQTSGRVRLRGSRP